MASKEQTTVNLTKDAQRIKYDLAPIYGLKNILSAGLVLFNKLDGNEKQKLISEINKTVSDAELAYQQEIRGGETDIRARIKARAEELCEIIKKNCSGSTEVRAADYLEKMILNLPNYKNIDKNSAKLSQKKVQALHDLKRKLSKSPRSQKDPRKNRNSAKPG